MVKAIQKESSRQDGSMALIENKTVWMVIISYIEVMGYRRFHSVNIWSKYTFGYNVFHITL